MIGEGKIREKIVIDKRMDSVKTFATDIKDKGVVPALIGIGTRFGENNRALIKGITGK